MSLKVAGVVLAGLPRRFGEYQPGTTFGLACEIQLRFLSCNPLSSVKHCEFTG